LKKLGYSEQVVMSFNESNDSCFKVWYPIDKQIEKIEEVNTELRKHAFELELVTLGADMGDLSSLPLPVSQFVEDSFDKLNTRLDPATP